MGNTHSTGSDTGKWSTKLSQQNRKDNMPRMNIISQGKYNKKVSPTPVNKIMDDAATHRESKYISPNNEQELDRLVQVHFIYKYLFGANFLAPVKDLLSSKQSGGGQHQWSQNVPLLSPPRVLDIACGNGTWILEMATEFPESQFHGIDVLANYPTLVKPANTFFSQCDILDPQGLPYSDDYFDYIHMRQVYSCFSEQDWVTIITEIKRLLKPGGYVELQDIDPLLGNMGPISYDFFAEFYPSMKKWHGVNILWARRMFDILKDVGNMTDVCRNVKALQFDMPGPVGNMIQNSMRLALESFRTFFEKHNNLSNAEYNRVIDDILKETVIYQSYFNYYCCWGRKPLYATAYHQQGLAGGDSFKRYSATPHSHNNITLGTVTSPPGCNMNVKSGKETTLDASCTNSTFCICPSDQHHHQIISLAKENISDIDQFAEGYED